MVRTIKSPKSWLSAVTYIDEVCALKEKSTEEKAMVGGFSARRHCSMSSRDGTKS